MEVGEYDRTKQTYSLMKTKLFDDTFYAAEKDRQDSLCFFFLPFAVILAKRFLSGEITDKKVLLYVQKNYFYKNFFLQMYKPNEKTSFFCDPALIALFSLPSQQEKKGYCPSKEEIVTFLSDEAQRIKKDPSKKLGVDNTMPVTMLGALCTLGAIIFYFLVKDPEKKFQKFIEIIKKLNGGATKEISIDCRYLMRYILNGWHERLWYENTNKQIMQLFPDVDPKVVANFFAITSQNADIEGNTKKTLRALRAFELREAKNVLLKLKKKPEMISSLFGEKYLPAQIKYLNEIAQSNQFLSDRSIYSRRATKIVNFSRAIQGDANAFALDFWVHVAFKGIPLEKVDRKSLATPPYTFFRTVYFYVRLLSALTKMQPRHLQAVIWVGNRSQRIRKTGQMYYGPLVEAARANQVLF